MKYFVISIFVIVFVSCEGSEIDMSILTVFLNQRILSKVTGVVIFSFTNF
jgi:hypothetical protein